MVSMRFLSCPQILESMELEFGENKGVIYILATFIRVV